MRMITMVTMHLFHSRDHKASPYGHMASSSTAPVNITNQAYVARRFGYDWQVVSGVTMVRAPGSHFAARFASSIDAEK